MHGVQDVYKRQGSRKKMEVFMTEDKNLVIVDNREIQNMIYAIRGKQVMVDSDLATRCV